MLVGNRARGVAQRQRAGGVSGSARRLVMAMAPDRGFGIQLGKLDPVVQGTTVLMEAQADWEAI